jgi:DNA-binding MarR family transcriptional regulator
VRFLNKDAHVGLTVRCLHHKIGREIASISGKQFGESTTPVQSWIVHYLYDNRDKEIFQKDLEARFSVRRSTMTSILQLMEKNGLIVKEDVPTDKRLKKLILTPLAVEKQKKMALCIDELDKKIKSGISEEELNAFFAVAEKISANLDS